MNIQHFSQQGKRANNEDSVGQSQGLLTVCDGMGGHVSGERASAFVVDAMLKAFDTLRPTGKLEIQQQLNKVQVEMNWLLTNEPLLEGMGTTFTGIFRTPDVWFAAHIGDSRIYLIRPAERKLWHTWDHSLVGELMRTKAIEVEAGRFHHLSNRISNAIIAKRENKLANASIVKIDELKAGDILILCSDGVVEGWSDWELTQLFSDGSLTFEQKCQKIAAQCDALSRDNNTAIIAEIEATDAFSYGCNDELEWTTFDEVKADYDHYHADDEETVSEQPAQPTKPKTDIPNTKTVPAKPKHERHSQPAPEQPKGNKTLGIVIAIAVVVLAIVVYFIKKR